MIDRRSLEEAIVGLIEGAEFDTEVLENIVDNCRSEIGILTKDDDSYYIELVCKCHALALIELSKR